VDDDSENCINTELGKFQLLLLEKRGILSKFSVPISILGPGWREIMAEETYYSNKDKT
jgi:hypothetical protein